MRLLIGTLTFLLAAATARAETNALITTVAELHLTAFANRPEDIPFDLLATVSSTDFKVSPSFSITDGTAAANVDNRSPDGKMVIRPGDRVRIRGYIRRLIDGNSYPQATAIDILSHGPRPTPLDCKLGEIYAGALLYRLIRISGTVIDAFRDEADARFAFLVISNEDETVYASTTDFEPDEEISRFIGATVSVIGTIYAYRNVGPRAKLKYGIGIFSQDDIRILEPAPSDPYAVPVLSGSVHDIYKGKMPVRRKAAGKVLAVWQRNRFLVRTPSGELSRIELAKPNPPAFGDCVEAVGIPETDFYHLNLSRAEWRSTACASVKDADVRSIAAEQLFFDKRGLRAIQMEYFGTPVRLRGCVLSVSAKDVGTLILQTEKCQLPVDFSSVPDVTPRLEPGSEIEATGVCVMDTENWIPQTTFPHVRGLFVVIRTPDDIRVLSRPPWWTPQRLLIVICSLLALLAVIGVWNRILRKLVTRRGLQLFRAQIARAKSELRTVERTRLAVELHDTISQNLTGASMQIDAAERFLDKSRERTLHHLGIASKTLISCRKELRNCIWDLRNQALEEHDLNNAIRRTLQQHTEGVELHIRFNVSRTRLGDDTTHALMRIIRELAINAVRHGKAKTIRIAGALDGGLLRFSVADDGCGFDPETRPGITDGHFGLQGIAERIRPLDGEIKIESEHGHGTHIAVTLRLPDAKQRA